MSETPSHPRETYDFEGGSAAERAFTQAMDCDRLAHAWLISGPEGVGKATFAYRVARRLLGASRIGGPLAFAADDPICRLVAGRAHPDLLVLEREGDDGKSRRQIPVDEARQLPEFFAKTPAMASWRVAIVDTADDLNTNGANALLKTLEEPPERGVILLLSHRPGAVLSTLRSRCRILRFAAPEREATARWLASRIDGGPEEALRLAEMAGGAPGRAWRLARARGLVADEAARALLAALPTPDPADMQAMADGFRGSEGAERFALLFELLAARVRQTVVERSMSGAGDDLDGWGQAYEMLIELPQRVEAVNLDRTDAFFTALERLKAVAC